MLMKQYEVTITLIEDMLGTVPKNREVYTRYIADKVDKRKAEDQSKMTDDEKLVLMDEEALSVPVDQERGWTGFHTNDQGLFLFDYQIKGFIKEAGNVLKDQMGADGDQKISALKSKIDSYLFVFPRRIQIGMKVPDGTFERPLRAMTMQGPRVTLVKSDLVSAGTSLSFTIKLLQHKELNEDVLRDLLEYGQFQGLGQFRNGSFGRFTYEMKEVQA